MKTHEEYLDELELCILNEGSYHKPIMAAVNNKDMVLLAYIVRQYARVYPYRTKYALSAKDSMDVAKRIYEYHTTA